MFILPCRPRPSAADASELALSIGSTLFARGQALAGSKVKAASGKNGDPYLWAPYTSWSYTDMYVEH
jgi:hypothetical protein